MEEKVIESWICWKKLFYAIALMYNYVFIREYDKLLKATVRRKLALRQQKAIIKSYLKSVQLRGSCFQGVNEFKFVIFLSLLLQHNCFYCCMGIICSFVYLKFIANLHKCLQGHRSTSELNGDILKRSRWGSWYKFKLVFDFHSICNL